MWNEQTRLAELLTKHLDPAAPIFWTSLENKALSMVSGMFGKLRGVRRGLPDVMVIHLTGAGREVTFVELKSRRAKASNAPIKLREELLVVGAKWWMARSARAAMMSAANRRYSDRFHRIFREFSNESAVFRQAGRGKSPKRENA